ncbi:glucose-6-phosphate isomerase [Candidatus Micrarchaeota archaeon]|nr:glucose-6-phosphate isomerase [Candidatus Micrarchaeota archaeon]
MEKLDALPLNAEFDDKTLVLYIDGKRQAPSVRTVGEMKEVIADKVFLRKADPLSPLYFMYRNVMRPHDAVAKVGYDITVIRPHALGREFCKTLGHYHAVAEGSLHSYPEVYEVLAGKAIYLLQKLRGKSGEVGEVIAIDAVRGDKVVIPPDYGHVSINASKTMPLVMSNVPDGAVGKGDYTLFRRKKGAAYFFYSNGTVGKNTAYSKLPTLARFKANAFDPGDILASEQGVNLYASYNRNPKLYDFLTKPDLFYEMMNKSE